MYKYVVDSIIIIIIMRSVARVYNNNIIVYKKYVYRLTSRSPSPLPAATAH